MAVPSSQLILSRWMSDLLKLVETYRFTRGWPDREGLAVRILTMIEKDLTLFIVGAINSAEAEDVIQETLHAIITSLATFKGKSNGEFWAWCYRIARNKINNHRDKQTSNLRLLNSEEHIWQLVEYSMQPGELSGADRHDLSHAMKLLTESKPECHDYLWQHFVFGLPYSEIAAQQNLTYDNVRMRIGRCLDEVQRLVS